MEAYTLTQSDLEDLADVVKTVIVGGLVKEGLLESDIAEDWARTHTLIARKKSIFRTISRLWKDTAEPGGLTWRLVRDITACGG